MAYQFGVLTCIVVAATISVSSIIIAIWQRDLEVIVAVAMFFGVTYWRWDVPDGFVRRTRLLFRDGVPLAPYGFRKNATLGYWLGIPIIYVGHVITAGTLYLFWGLLKRPTEELPLGIAVGYALVAYALGIGLVESSYRLWAKSLDGATPGDPGSSPRRPVFWSISLASILIVFLYVADHPIRTMANSTLSAQNSQDSPDAQPAPISPVNLVDFIPATDTGWTGEAAYRVDNTSRITRMPATLHGSLSGGDTVSLQIGFPDSSRESEEYRFQLNAEGHRLNSLAVVERTELANGVLRIVAYEDGNDSGGLATLRATFIIGPARFQLQHHTEQEAGQFLLRDEYKFVRLVSSN